MGDGFSDPREGLIKEMIAFLSLRGTMMAFNQSFEIARTKELAVDFPEYKNALLSLIPRFVDLIDPFRSLGYYHPEFNGSFSLKSILPSLFPERKELNYKNLNIQDGGTASEVYANLHRLKDKRHIAQTRADLLEYCKLDTLAMVRIWDELLWVSEEGAI